MKPRLRLLFALVVVAPIASLPMFAVRAARNDRARAAAEVMAERTRRLEERAADLRGVVAGLERALLAATNGLPRPPADLRGAIRRTPLLRRLLVLDARGMPRFPPAGGEDEEEVRWLAQTRAVWGAGGTLRHPPRGEDAASDSGWLHLPDAGGLLFWRASGGGVVAVGVAAEALLAALIERLPATEEDQARERTALVDPTGRVAYQWGGFTPAKDATPRAAVALAPPLAAWRLEDRGPAVADLGSSFGVVVGAGALGLAVLGAGVWLYRESTRELRVAAQRVSFVNQVSHELKTPLTNVRLYAELLEDHVDADDTVGRQRLGVVVAESERLSRLITNILTFARAERGRLCLQRTSGCIDDVVRETLARFAPAFETAGVAVQTTLNAPARVAFDRDAVSQILGNLLGNVEKYAPRGELTLETTQKDGVTTVVVSDTGPGIPREARERVFEPFLRLDGSRHEGVAGTGIGLGIARDLARLHGGDVRISDGARGARFELTLNTEPAA